MRFFHVFVLAMSVVLLTGAASYADGEKPFQLSLAPDFQIVDQKESIKGVRLSIYGRNQNVTGLDIGVVSETKGDFKGAGLGFIIPPVVNLVDGNLTGVQWCMAYSRVGKNALGWQSGIVTRVEGDMVGLETGLVHLDEGTTRGVQFGLFNKTTHMRGVQIGFINLTEKMYGLQIGIWNQIESKEKWKVLPIVNWVF